MPLKIPTNLDKEQIEEFKMLYQKHFNLALTDDEARQKGVQFLQFMTLIIDNNDHFFD